MSFKGFFSWMNVVLLLLITTACAPTKLYTEQFSSIAVSYEKDKLIVLGDHYDYVFDMPTHVKKSLNAGFLNNLTCTINREVYISRNGDTLGLLRLDLTENATQAEINEAFDIGYSQAENGLIYYSSYMYGTRIASADTNDTKTILLNQTFRFRVSDSQQAYDRAHSMSPLIIGTGTAFVAAFPATLLLTLPVIGLKP